MAEKQRPDDGPSLEMPSLGSLFKRGRKKSAPEPAPHEPSAEDFDRLVRGEGQDASGKPVESAVIRDESALNPVESAVTRDDGDAPVEEPAASVEETTTEDEETPEVAPAVVDPADAAPEEPEVEQTAVRGIAPVSDEVQQTEVLPEHDLIAAAEEADLADLEEDEVVDDEQPTTVIEPAARVAKPRRFGRRAASSAVVADDTDVEQEATAVAAGTSAEKAGGATGSTTDDTTDDEIEEAQDDLAEPRRTLADFQLPALPQAAAAAVTGAIVGLLAVGLTYFGLQGCEAVKGTSACGGPGIPILVAIMVVLVIVGSILLGAWRVTDPTSTSFLAVGLLAVIALLFLINVIFSPTMVVVIPLVSVGTYCLSQWVTAHFIEED